MHLLHSLIICEHARKHGVIPVLTFDQPLWWKAFMIIESEPEESNLRGIVLHLGGFHTEMNFLGCIGYLMDSSGLQETLESIYVPTAVVHMLSGKAIARAVHAHFIIDAALNALILRNVLNTPLPCQPETPECNDDDGPDIAEAADLGNSQYLDEAHTFHEKLMSGIMCAEEIRMLIQCSGKNG